MKGFKMANMWILAQAQTQDAAEIITSEPVSEQETTAVVSSESDQTQPARPQQRGFDSMTFILIAAIIFFVFMMYRGPRKKQQEHQKMVQSLQKNDRVRTIGGIYGTVVDVKENEIVLKIDESNNTKIRISPNAVGSKLSE
ncbi:MAG: preprotein translocase subunit YajC [Phycisphaerae bacterium]